MRNLFVVLLSLLAFPLLASSQSLEVNGGYTHISGDGGLDGFSAGGAIWVAPRVSLAVDYDSAWDSSHLGAFELTQTGLIVTKSHLQNFLVGPRISFPGMLKHKETYLPRLWPFAEVQLGGSHLNSKLEDPNSSISQSASDNGFTWMVGGGGDYRLTSHWVTRFKLDFLRTHFADTGQSRVRFGLGIAYTFGERGAKEAAEAKRKADAELAAAEAQKRAMEQAKCEECKRQAAEEAASASPTLPRPIAGLVCLGYPLQSGATGALRDQVLLGLRTPILFVQGTRDPLCPLDKLAAVRPRMTAPNQLFVVEGGDHSLEVSRPAIPNLAPL